MRYTYFLFILGLIILLSSCDPDPDLYGKDPQKMVGLWEAEGGETIRVFNDDTYSLSCEEGEVSFGKTGTRWDSSVLLVDFYLLPQGKVCAKKIWDFPESLSRKYEEMEVDSFFGTDLRINYRYGHCRRKLCAAMGDVVYPNLYFVKVSDDPNSAM